MQLTPLQQPWDGKISNSMDDQEVPRELVLKIKEDFQANGGNKAALEEQYSADVVHRVLGVVKNSVKNDDTSGIDEEDAKKKNVVYAFKIGEKVQIDGEGPIGIVDYMTSSQVFVKFGNGEIHEYSFSEVVPVRK